MAVERGDWVRVPRMGEGEVTEVRGEKAVVDLGKYKVTVGVGRMVITTRPQTGRGAK